MKWLSEVPPPSESNYALGPVGRGHIHHRFFKDFKAPFGRRDARSVCEDSASVLWFSRVSTTAYMYSGPGVPLALE
jgi:hypothetical protein